MDASLLLCAALLASPAQDPQPTQDATLTVTVVDGTNGQALAGQDVWLLEREVTRGRPPGEESRGPVGARLKTDDLGQVVYDVPARDVVLELSVSGSPNGYSNIAVDMAPFAVGESRAVTLELTPSERRPFHVLFLDSETGEPIPGVRLGFRDSSVTFSTGAYNDPWMHAKDGEDLGALIATGGDDGRVNVQWIDRQRLWVDVQAPGYSLLGMPIEGTHPDPLRPKLIRIPRAGNIVGTYWNADGLGAPDLTVGVLASSWGLTQPTASGGYRSAPDRLWRTTTDAAGRFELRGLPAGARLTFGVRRGFRILHEQEVILGPGETRNLSNSVRSTHDLDGRLLDPSGNPIPAVLIQLSPAEPRTRGDFGYLPSPSLNGRTRTTLTDQEGRFDFGRVPLGEWLVGVGKRSRLSRPPATWAAYARRIRVPVGHGVTLSAYQGSLTGQVRDPAGNGLEGMTLWAGPVDGFGSLQCKTQEDGSFTLAPLGPGPHRLRVMGLPRAWYFEAMTGAAGDHLEFVGRLAGTLEGRALDGDTQQPQTARFAVVGEDLFFLAPGHRFEQQTRYEGLVPGTYSLVATTEDGRFGMRAGIEVRGGETSAEQVVRLKPGGRIRLVAPATDSRSYVVQVGEFWVALLNNGDYREVVVPAGRVAVSLLKEGRPFPGSERRLEITVGATTVFEPE
jgi:hypothetical protein